MGLVAVLKFILEKTFNNDDNDDSDNNNEQPSKDSPTSKTTSVTTTDPEPSTSKPSDTNSSTHTESSVSSTLTSGTSSNVSSTSSKSSTSHSSTHHNRPSPSSSINSSTSDNTKTTRMPSGTTFNAGSTNTTIVSNPTSNFSTSPSQPSQPTPAPGLHESTRVTPSPMPTPPGSTIPTHNQLHSKVGLIAGAVIGTVMGLVFITLAIFCFKRHRRSIRHSGTKEDREEITEFAKPSIRSMTSHGSISAIASSLGTPRTSATIGHRVTYNLGFEDSARLMEQGIHPTQTLTISMPHSEPSPLDLNMPHTPPTILSAVEHAPYPFIYQKPPRSPSDYSTSMPQTASQVESVATASEAGAIIPRPPEVHLNYPKATEPDNVDLAVSEILRAMAAQKRQKRQQSISGRLSRSSVELPLEPFENPDQTSTDYKVFYDHHNDTPSLVHSNESRSTWNGYHEN